MTDPHPADGTADAAPRPRILLVDDDALVRMVASDLLGEIGYDVVTTASGTEGIAAFQADPERFDLVLTDLSMPMPDGLAVLAAVRDLRADLPVLLVSGRPLDGDATQGDPHVGFLQKPYGLATLETQLGRMLGGTR